MRATAEGLPRSPAIPTGKAPCSMGPVFTAPRAPPCALGAAVGYASTPLNAIPRPHPVRWKPGFQIGKRCARGAIHNPSGSSWPRATGLGPSWRSASGQPYCETPDRTPHWWRRLVQPGKQVSWLGRGVRGWGEPNSASPPHRSAGPAAATATLALSFVLSEDFRDCPQDKLRILGVEDPGLEPD